MNLKGLRSSPQDLFRDYVQHIADHRLERIGLPLQLGSPIPFSWRETIDLAKDVRSNAKALEAIHAGLTHDPLRETVDPFARRRPLNGSLKKAGEIQTLLFHYLELLEREERYEEGAELSLKMLAFGHSVAKDDTCCDVASNGSKRRALSGPFPAAVVNRYDGSPPHFGRVSGGQ